MVDTPCREPTLESQKVPTLLRVGAVRFAGEAPLTPFFGLCMHVYMSVYLYVSRQKHICQCEPFGRPVMEMSLVTIITGRSLITSLSYFFETEPL